MSQEQQSDGAQWSGQARSGTGSTGIGSTGTGSAGTGRAGDRPSDRERWNERYREQACSLRTSAPDDAASAAGTAGGVDRRFQPPALLTRLSRLLPSSGPAIDLAGGTGGAALQYRAMGLRSVLVDVSDEALAQASERAGEVEVGVGVGVPLTVARLDIAGRSLGEILVELRAQGAISEEAVLVSCFHYLDRTLLGSVARELPSGAMFMAAIATVTNLERNPRPTARFLLAPGELRALVLGSHDPAPGLEVLHDREGWNAEGRHEAELLVRGTGPAGVGPR